MLNKASYLGSGHEDSVTHLEFAWSSNRNHFTWLYFKNNAESFFCGGGGGGHIILYCGF